LERNLERQLEAKEGELRSV